MEQVELLSAASFIIFSRTNRYSKKGLDEIIQTFFRVWDQINDHRLSQGSLPHVGGAELHWSVWDAYQDLFPHNGPMPWQLFRTFAPAALCGQRFEPVCRENAFWIRRNPSHCAERSARSDMSARLPGTRPVSQSRRRHRGFGTVPD